MINNLKKMIKMFHQYKKLNQMNILFLLINQNNFDLNLKVYMNKLHLLFHQVQVIYHIVLFV
jgi:hypothetical protein